MSWTESLQKWPMLYAHVDISGAAGEQTGNNADAAAAAESYTEYPKRLCISLSAYIQFNLQCEAGITELE